MKRFSELSKMSHKTLRLAKVLLFSSILLFGVSFFSQAQTTVTIGTAVTQTQYNPLYSYYGYNYTQQIYTAAEITAGGGSAGMQLNAIKFYWAGTGNLTNAGTWTVFVGNTTQNVFTTTTWVPLASLTNVYSGAVSLPAAAGWVTITLTTPIIWAGNNLVIAVDENVAGYGSTAYWNYTTTSANYRSIYYYSDGTNPDPAAPPTGTITYNRPNVQLEFISLTPCTGTPATGAAVISSMTGCPGASFTLSATGLSVGSGLTYQWQTSTSPTGPWTNIATGTTSTFVTSTTTDAYYQLVSTCANSASTSISNVVSYFPVGNVCGCGAYPNLWASNTADEEITSVTVGSMTNTSTCSTLAPGPGSIVTRYSNYTGFVTGPSVMHGETVSFSLTQTSCGGSYNNGFQLYIDWNQDGDFGDAGEQAYSQPVAASGNHTKTGTFVVPVTAAVGITRMRIVNAETTFPSTNNYAQTTTYSYGETEDYCITINAAAACTGTPTAGVAAISSSIGCTGTSFSLSSTGATVASGITYQWQTSASATGPWANIGGATTPSYSTSTTVNAYYQLIVTCTISGQAATSNVVSYTVTGNACQCGTYPAIYSSTTADEEITNVTIGTMNNSSTCATVAPGPGSILNRYSNYTGFVTGPTVQLGEVVNFSLTQTSCGGSYGNGFQLYIDYNQDGDFLDAGEQVYSQPVSASGNHTKTGTFTIPVTATQGITRMRVVNVETTFPTTNNYANTTTFSYGETEDYCITLVAATPCAGTPVGGTASPATQQVASGTSASLSISGFTVASGVTFQWQQSASAGGPFTNVTGGTGATTPSYTTAPLTTAMYYRCVVTCTASGQSANSTVGSATVVQTVNMQNGSVTTCGSLFYDTGGATGTYSASSNITMTVYPSDPGSMVVVTFTSFVTENSYEHLRIYNGNSATAPLLGDYTGTATIPSFTSTAADGSLTFVFTSDGSVQYAGWVASLTCYNPCVYTTPVFTPAGPYCSGVSIPALPTTSNDGVTGVWSPAIDSLATTTYTFTPDPGQCALSTTMTITINPNNPATFNSVGPYCPGVVIPALPLTSNEGINGTWSPAIDNMNTTEYMFTADGGVCAWTNLTITINTFPSNIQNNSGSTELTCDLDFISLTAQGGVSYSWSGGSPINAVNTISAPGTYTVTVTGANGCTQSESIDITQNITPPVITLVNNTGTTEFICSVPQIEYTASGGATYSWSGGNTPTTADNIFTTAGTYTLTVTGTNGCTSTSSITLTQPAPLTIVETVTNALCFGLDGTADINVTAGGTSPYTILWDDGSTNFININIPVDTDFGYTVTDADLCPTAGTVFVTEPTLLTVTLNATDLLCFGSDDGTASVNLVSGGTPSYTYRWGNGNTTQALSNLSIGQYYITVSDANNCEAYSSINVLQPPQLTVSLTSTDAVCGEIGGSVTTDVAGGIPGYFYSWSIPGSANSISDLAPGTYSVTVRDANSCTVEQSAVIGKTGIINANIAVVQYITCSGIPDGILLGGSTNGAQPQSFSWSNGDATAQIDGLDADTYYLTVTDGWNCLGNAEVTLDPPDFVVMSSYVTDITCYGLNNGKINIGVTGGAPPYNIVWNPAYSGTSLTNLGPGDYSVTVTDTRDCSDSEDFTLLQPEQMSLDFTKKDISCYGKSDGSITMLASGGYEPYTYTVSTGGFDFTGDDLDNLHAGNYTLMVRDNNDCTATEETYIIGPAEMEASITSAGPSCIDNNDGYIRIYAVGGTSPYKYIYNGNIQANPLIVGLKQGIYFIAVEDTAGCRVDIGDIQLNDFYMPCLNVPNAFSPNGDGVNDIWEIENIEKYPGADIRVFNRWGQVIYQTQSGVGDPWDGRYDGKIVPSGVYVYVVNLKNSEEPYTGTVSIVY